MKLLTLLLLSTLAQADDITISWEYATQREDGTAINLLEIGGTNVTYQLDGWDYGPWFMPVPRKELTLIIKETPICLKLATVLVDGEKSPPTNWLCLAVSEEK